MIYEVYLDGQLLYYPNDESYSISNSKLETSLNEAGSFECEVPKNNMLYDTISESLLRSGMIQVLKDGKEIFYGEIREITQTFDFKKRIYAVGELAFLFDSIQPQKRYQGTPADMFSAIIASHNSQVESKKKFTVGNVTVTDPNNYILRFTNYEDTLSAIREKLCDKLKGYLRIRKVNGVRYIDLIPLEQYGHYCTQEIQFGENLLDYACNFTSADIATAVIPLGAKIDEANRSQSAVDGLDEYLTIKSVNNNVDYLVNQTAAARFGYVKVVKKWDDVTDASNLKSKGQAWLTSAQYANMELNVSAVDLSMRNQDIDTFEVGDTIHAWAEPYGMDTTFPVQKKTIYLNDLPNNNISLGNNAPSKSYTSQASRAVEALKEEIPQTSPMLKEAKDRALAMLLDETQDGHVVYEYDSTNSYITAINICDERTIAGSLKRWRWAQNGLAFLKRNTISSAWSEVGVAMTANGEIVGDFVTAGLIKLSGASTGSGGSLQKAHIQVFDGNTQVGAWGSDGITIKRGNIDINNGQFKVTNEGAVTIKSGSIDINSSNFKVNTSGKMTCSNVDINGGDLNIGSGVFHVDSTGKMTCTNANVKGKVQATSGYIGQDNAGWQIGDTDIHNGCTSMTSNVNGTYVGTSGIRNVLNGKYTELFGGEIHTNGVVIANGVGATGNVNAGGQVYSAGAYKTQNAGGGVVSGATGIVGWLSPDGSGGYTTHVLTVTNGLITQIQ